MVPFRAPESWRALPMPVQRRVIKDARRGLPPPEDAVARAASEWAGWAVPATNRTIAVACVLFAVTLAAAVAVGPRALVSGASSAVLMLAGWLQRRDAERVRAAVARRPAR